MVMLIDESDYWCSSSSPCRESIHDLRLSSHSLQRIQWEQREGNRSRDDWTVSKPCGSNRRGGRIRIGLRTNTVLRHWTTETVNVSPYSESISFVISYFEFQFAAICWSEQTLISAQSCCIERSLWDSGEISRANHCRWCRKYPIDSRTAQNDSSPRSDPFVWWDTRRSPSIHSIGLLHWIKWMLNENTSESWCHPATSFGENSRRNRFDFARQDVSIDITLF